MRMWSTSSRSRRSAGSWCRKLLFTAYHMPVRLSFARQTSPCAPSPSNACRGTPVKPPRWVQPRQPFAVLPRTSIGTKSDIPGYCRPAARKRRRRSSFNRGITPPSWSDRCTQALKISRIHCSATLPTSTNFPLRPLADMTSVSGPMQLETKACKLCDKRPKRSSTSASLISASPSCTSMLTWLHRDIKSFCRAPCACFSPPGGAMSCGNASNKIFKPSGPERTCAKASATSTSRCCPVFVKMLYASVAGRTLYASSNCPRNLPRRFRGNLMLFSLPQNSK
mmetsp:Transcript_7631/g.21854  ORF Transcript_7631/g.21854 Transcript_7631/m.21854 type:complete len:281 (-) Transcript_7631:213-1055(-)